MDWKGIVTLIVNGALTLAVVIMWGTHRVTWDQALIAIGLLATPSAGSALLNRGKP
jgi:hypothetical protein